MSLTRLYVRLIRRGRRLRARIVGVDEPPAPEPVSGLEVLERVAALPISTWSYTWDPGNRHLGPMAQDFHAAFGVGESDRRINPIDAAGVSLVAIQALVRRLEALEREIAELRVRVGDPGGPPA